MKGTPVAISRDGEDPIRIRIESRRLELSLHVPVRVYYRILLENERPRRDYDLPYLYENGRTGQWYLVRRLRPYEMPPNATAFRVPKGHVFAMGDNRENSIDSRGWGPVPLHMIKGKAVLIIWSTKERSPAPFWQFWKRLRFDRMGRVVRAQYGEFDS